MSAIFPPATKGGVPPGDNVCNGYLPKNAVIGEGPLYVAADCTTYLTDCQMNSLASEILAAVDALGFGFNATRINNLGEALSAKFTALQTALDAKVTRSGDTMSGPLVIPCPPDNDNEAACKFYIDNALDACCRGATDKIDDAIANFQTELDSKVSRAGDFMTGPLLLSGDPTLPGHAVTRNYIEQVEASLQAEINNRVLRTGDTMTGPLILPDDDPTNALEAVTKRYADSLSSGVIVAPNPPSVPSGRLWFNSIIGRLFIHYDDGDSLQWVDLTGAAGGGTGTGSFLPLTGGSLTGALILSAAPTAASVPNQAATKGYVDSQIALGGTFIDAPADGEIYARQDNGWVPITVTTDGGQY